MHILFETIIRNILDPLFIGIIMLVSKKILSMSCTPLCGAHMGSICLHNEFFTSTSIVSAVTFGQE